MTQKNLKAFGAKLRQLRKKAGLYQEELADQLSDICDRHKRSDLRVDGNRISKWERAYVDKGGREWKPKREHVLYLIELFADPLTMEEALEWAAQAGYQFNPSDLQRFFPPDPASSPSHAQATSAIPRDNLKRLKLPPESLLFGVGQAQEQLCQVLGRQNPPWLVAIDGIGGIGKTSLASAVAREIMAGDRFHDLAWVSAKQAEFQPGADFQAPDGPALTVESLVDYLLEQLNGRQPLPASPEEKLIILTGLLEKEAYLVLIDNLETVVDYQALLPLLRKWANPSKFLLTSRHSLHSYVDVFCHTLKELNQAHTLDLLHSEAEMRGVPALAEASQSQLETIYQVVGGNPLALKLVVGQLNVLPLSQVLDNLKLARGKSVDDLYTYIYWQAWQALDDASRAVLLTMPLAQGGNLTHITALSELEPVLLDQALEHLIRLSLVDVGGNLEERRYYIHRLTETFLLHEVAKWQ